MQQYRKELTPIIYNSSALKVLHFEIAPNEKCFRPHWHDRMEILRIRRGEIFAGYDTNISKVCAGQLMLIPPHTPHKGYAGDYELEYDVFMFDIRSFYNDTEICKKYLPAIYEGRAKLIKVTDQPDMVACLDKIFSAETAVNNCAETVAKESLEITADLYRLLYLMLKHCLISFDDNVRSDNSTSEFTQYIESNYAQELTTASLSEHFGYTTAHFSRKFKEATGLTPTNYIKIYRVEEAYKLIKAGGSNISSIAALCGFPDANYFTRCFKAHFGVPPSHFIRLKD